MKNLLKTFLPGLLVCASQFTAQSQTPPRLSITNSSPALAQISWTNVVGTSYRVLSTPALAPSAWKPLEDAFSSDPKVTVNIFKAGSSMQFFRLLIPTNGTLPAVQIFSPTNSQVVSGEIEVRVGAQITNQLQGVNLYLDDALVGYVNNGGMKFDVDTSHFVNGTHTLYASAIDTVNNEIFSSTNILNFQNSVRWLDAPALFNNYVAVDAVADFYPANWLVSVTDNSGVIVRTILGSTADGIIQTTWDGLDDNGQPLPVENLYQVTVDVTQTSSSMMAASSLAINSGSTMVSSKSNRYGVTEYGIQTPAPNPLTTYQDMVKIYKQLTPKEKLIYPPLPPKPANNPNATTTKKMSAREMFLAAHPAASTSTLSAASGTMTGNAGFTSQRGSTKTLVWWENPWGSAETIVARVPISGSLNVDVINLCNQIAIRIGTAVGTVGNNRDMFGGNVQVIQTSSEVTQLKNNLNDPSVRALYFYGHGNATGNAFGTATTGIFATNLAALLGNSNVLSLPPNWGVFAGKHALITQKGFSFVFLDGCNTALGDLPDAFGISKTVSGAQINEAGIHKRAFMGWTAPVVFQFDPDHINWTLKFWSTWLDDAEAYEVTLIQAKAAADAYRPSVPNNVPIKWYGNSSLKWKD